jgi:Undecaprenyl-phosphate glucose phosphotransferase
MTLIETGAGQGRLPQGRQGDGRALPAAEAAAPHGSAKKRSAGAPALLEITSFALRGLEIAVVVLSALVSAVLSLEYLSDDDTRLYINAIFVASIFYGIFSEAIGAYDLDVRFSVRAGWSRALLAWLSTFVFLVTLGFLFKVSETFSRAWGLTWFVGGGAGICVARAGLTLWLRSLKRHGIFNQRVAIFGAGKQGVRLVQYIRKSDRLTMDLVGFFDDKPAARTPSLADVDLPVLGDLEDLLAFIRAGDVDQVMIALPWSADDRIQEVVARIAVMPVRIRLAPDMANFIYLQRPFVMLDGLPVMTLFERPISGTDQLSKKVEDFILSLTLLLLLAPVLLAVAILIKLDSPGPVFFRQPREGFNHQTFRIWKFRTMRQEASQADGIEQARRADPRVTRVGRFLRRTSIDELPQLFNVLTGEMSLVGPRPHAPSTKAGNRLFREVVATYAARHKVKPGITGWAQVCGWRGETDTEEKLLGRVEHDLYYIDNWSVFFDFYILFRTGIALFSSRAY